MVPGQRRLVVEQAGQAIDAQAPRRFEVDEQQAHGRIRLHIAEAAELAIAVVAGKFELARAGDAHEARVAALVRAIGPAHLIRRGQEEHRTAFDEGPVLLGEGAAAQLLVQPVGQAP
jgi:hypothetical protein